MAFDGGSVVADLHGDISEAWKRSIADAAISGRPVFHIKQLSESITGRVQIEHFSENNFGSLIPHSFYCTIKIIVEALVSLVCLAIFIIPLLLFALLVKLESPGPAIFRQERMGYKGIPFKVYKFRTMKVSKSTVVRNSVITTSNDQRITKIGKFLRKSRIDEIPQLLNVLKGEMSLIGPRPEALELSLWYEQELDFYRYRHIVRPGITGWAQVNQGHVADLDAVTMKLQYDFYYIKNYSPWLDLLIAMRTVFIVLTGHGAK